jgi:hypothetical protein
MQIDKVVIVTKKTPLAELVLRLNSVGQARFYLEQNGISFAEYEQVDASYQRALDTLVRQLPRDLKRQVIDRDLLPNYQFGDNDVVVTLGPDGLVINVAKYLKQQPIIALNPDPTRVDGVLIPFMLGDFAKQLERLRRGNALIRPISMAQVQLNDGQTLYAVNDLFIGPRSHGSARYELLFDGIRERQSSSGIIVSTGAGCTGWMRSIVTGAWQIARAMGGSNEEVPDTELYELGWETEDLWFMVREPFTSKTSQANIVIGRIAPGQSLELVSQMPDYGVIFSDGIEADYLSFNSGATARISLADRKAHLLVAS